MASGGALTSGHGLLTPVADVPLTRVLLIDPITLLCVLIQLIVVHQSFLVTTTKLQSEKNTWKSLLFTDPAEVMLTDPGVGGAGWVVA